MIASACVDRMIDFATTGVAKSTGLTMYVVSAILYDEYWGLPLRIPRRVSGAFVVTLFIASR